MKNINICLCEYWKERRIKRAEKIFKEIMAEKLPNLLKSINLHIQVAQQIPSKINTMRLTNRHITVKMLKDRKS